MGRKAINVIGYVEPCVKTWLDTKEAMEFVGLGKDSFRKYVKNADCVVWSMVGKRRRYLKSSLEIFIAHHQGLTQQKADRNLQRMDRIAEGERLMKYDRY